MMRLRHCQRGEGGFTLVETLAALLVFSIVTLGLVPLVLSSLRGSNVARSFTLAKNATLEAMERVRGLPYRVEYANQPTNRRVDFLDLFYPDAAGGRVAGQSYSNGLFTTVCTRASTANPACLADKLPNLANFTLTARTCFSLVNAGQPACIANPANRAIPPSSYAWNLDTNGDGTPDAGATDAPPQGSQLMEITLTATWNVGDLARRFEMRTLISDRNFGARELSGTASVDYGARVRTGFRESGRDSQLTATVGSGESFLESTPLQILARQTIQAGELRLQDVTDVANAFDLVTPLAGAGGTAEAPGTVSVTTPVGPLVLQHPAGHPLAGTAFALLNTSSAPVVTAATSPTLAAAGEYSVASTATDPRAAYVTNRADDPRLHLDPNLPLFMIPGTAPVTGETAGDVGLVGTSSRRVETGAAVSLGAVRLLPTDFIANDPDSGGESSVILIDDFTAAVRCDARASASSAAEASWSATLRVWTDTLDDGSPDGSYGVPIPLGSSDQLAAGSPDPLQQLRTQNPLVYEVPNTPDDPNGHPDDVYLFPVTHTHGEDGDDDDVTHQHPGYFDRNESFATALQVEESVSGEDRVTVASIRDAVRMTTVPLHSSSQTSRLSIALGSLSCSSEDQR